MESIVFLEMIGVLTKLTTSGQRSHHLGLSSSIKNDTASIQPFITDHRMRYKSIIKYCVQVGHKADA